MHWPKAYAAHRRFIAPALNTPGARPVILGFILIESLYEIGQHLLGLFLATYAPGFAHDVIAGSTPLGLVVNLASFLILIASLAFVLALVHGRGLQSLLGPRDHLLRDAGVTFLAIAALFVGYELAINGVPRGPGISLRSLPQWAMFLLPGILALGIQISSEELFYRGYLQQQIAALLPHPAAWLILPNIAFAVFHFSPTAPLAENTAYLIWAFFFGLAASDLTARAGNLGPALGLHLANNAYAFLFLREMGGPDSGLALVLYTPPETVALAASTPPAFSLVAELLLLALTWGVARLVIRR